MWKSGSEVLNPQLGPSPVTPLFIVSLLANSLEANPVWNGSVLLDLLRVFQLDLERLDASHVWGI